MLQITGILGLILALAVRSQRYDSFVQSEQPSGPILVLIGDEDDRKQVALDFEDAVRYAGQRATSAIDNSPTAPVPQPFMTGDVFNNGRTDSVKLEISAVDASNPLDWRDLQSNKGLEDRYKRELKRRGYDFEDWETYTDFERDYLFTSGDFAPNSIDLDESVVVESQDHVELTSVNLLGSINRVIGDRYEYTDDDDIVVLFSEDGYDGLLGDGSDNGRSDEVPLTVRRETVQAAPGLESDIQSSGFSKTVEDVDDYAFVFTDDQVFSVDISALHLLRTSDIDFPPPPPSTGNRYIHSDLQSVPILYSGDQSSYMTGDRFANSRTDSERLTVVAIDPSTIQTNAEVYFDLEEVEITDIQKTDLEIVGEFHEHPENAILSDSLPLYQGENSEVMVGDLYDNGRTDHSRLTILRLTPQEQEEYDEAPTVKKVIRAKLYVEPVDTQEKSDAEEKPKELVLECESPDQYISGDLFDNGECDATRLTVNVLRPTPLPPPPPPAPSDQDDSWAYSFRFDAPPETPTPPKPTPHDQLSRLTHNSKFIKDMNIASEVKGKRQAFLDTDDVPVYYSSDPALYLGGDMFANRRTDVTKLRVILNSGESLKWQGTQSSNPGFLQ